MGVNKQELNKKLAEWAGFEFGTGTVDFPDIGVTEVVDGWHYPNKTFVPKWATMDGGLPNFPESLDACFKWLVPKLGSKDLLIWIRCDNIPRVTITDAIKDEVLITVLGKELALALCLAIEKLIDTTQ